MCGGCGRVRYRINPEKLVGTDLADPGLFVTKRAARQWLRDQNMNWAGQAILTVTGDG